MTRRCWLCDVRTEGEGVTDNGHVFCTAACARDYLIVTDVTR